MSKVDVFLRLTIKKESMEQRETNSNANYCNCLAATDKG